MKKILAIVLVLLMVLTVFAGCGGGTSSSGSGSSEPESSAVDLSKYPSGYPFKEGAYAGKTIEQWVQMTDRSAFSEELEALFAEFEKGTGAIVKEPGQKDLAGLTAAITSGSGPDIAACDQRFFINGALKGLIIPATDVLDFSEEIYKDKLNQSIVDLFTISGVPYIFNALSDGMPAAYIIYRKSAFDEAGVDDPYELWKNGEWNYETFNDICAELTYDSDDDGLIDKYALTGYMDGFWPGTVGGDANAVRWKDGLPEFALDDADLIEAYEEYNFLMQQEYYKAIGDPGVSFAGGKHAMLGAIGGWYVEGLIEEIGVDDLGYVPMPASPSNTTGVVKSMSYASGYFFTNNLDAENKDLAEEWIKYSLFWDRADKDRESVINDLVENRYGGNREWYDFEQELAKNAFFNNSEMWGNLANLTSGVLWNPEGLFAHRIQQVAPACQAEINAVYDEALAK